jgi:hypothetical protein
MRQILICKAKIRRFTGDFHHAKACLIQTMAGDEKLYSGLSTRVSSHLVAVSYELNETDHAIRMATSKCELARRISNNHLCETWFLVTFLCSSCGGLPVKCSHFQRTLEMSNRC